MGETRLALTTTQGQVLERFDDLPNWSKVESSVTCLGVAATEERQAELQQWLSHCPRAVRIWETPWVDAALAGAFLGRPGVMLFTEHWSTYNGCAAKNGPELICQAMVLAREPNHRTLSLVHGEGGLEWLSREGLTTLEQVSGPSRQRLQRLLGPLVGHREPIGPMRERALAVRSSLEELADYPGPDPASLALLARAARRLSDLLRVLVGRVRLPAPCPATWWDGRRQGPLWSALEVELQRYLPQLAWGEPADDAGRGCAALVYGELREEQRRALNPAAAPLAQSHQGIRAVGADAWRQLSRTTSMG